MSFFLETLVLEKIAWTGMLWPDVVTDR